jgi:tetratricopeptide (TPR) repeat protein
MSVPDIQHALELLRQRDVDAAISSLKKKVEELPAHLTAHVLLARAYEAKRDWDRALRSWENAHFLMPNSPIVIAGKERVLEKINEQDGRTAEATLGGIAPSGPESQTADAASDPAHEAPEDRGDASPSPEPPRQPSAEPEPRNRADRNPPQTEPGNRADRNPPQSEPQNQADRNPPSAKPRNRADRNPPQTEPQNQADRKPPEAANPISQAQALLSNTPDEPADAETDAAAQDTPSQDETTQAATTQDAPAEEASAAPMKEAPERPEIRTSRSPDTTSYRPDTAIIDAAASLLSRKPTPVADTPEDTPNDTPDEPPQDKTTQDTPEPSEATTADAVTTDSASPSHTAPPDTADADTADADAPSSDPKDAPVSRSGGSAESFIPDFAARHTAPQTDESTAEDPDEEKPSAENAQTPEAHAEEPQTDASDEEETPESIAATPTDEAASGTDETDAAGIDIPMSEPPSDAGPADAGAANAEPHASTDESPQPPQQGSYDTSELPESRFLDDLGPPETARPLKDEEEEKQAESGEAPSGEAPSSKKSSDAPEDESPSEHQRVDLSIPSPDDLMPSDPDLGTSSRDDTPDEDDDGGLSELEKLRRSAEAEARRGGARGGMSRPEISGASDDASAEDDDTIGDLDRLIEDLESARIEPRPDLDDLPAPNLESDVEDLVSETLARIYAAQSQYREAARIYVKLASQEPANARDHLENASDMRKKAEAKEAKERATGDGADSE